MSAKPQRRPGKARTGFRDTIDYTIERTGPEKSRRIDLGLELLAARCKYGVRLTYQEIAAWAGCTDGLIYQIEHKALKKLRHARVLGLLKNL